jgi:hypothetical protein
MFHPFQKNCGTPKKRDFLNATRFDFYPMVIVTISRVVTIENSFGGLVVTDVTTGVVVFVVVVEDFEVVEGFELEVEIGVGGIGVH